MKRSKKVLVLYACPSELIPKAAKKYAGKHTFPVRYAESMLISRAMPNHVVENSIALSWEKFTQELSFSGSGNVVDMIASCLLPIFSLSKEKWENAIEILGKAISDADTVIAIEYSPKRFGLTRDSKFDVADYMVSMIIGAKDVKFITWDNKPKAMQEDESVEE